MWRTDNINGKVYGSRVVRNGPALDDYAASAYIKPYAHGFQWEVYKGTTERIGTEPNYARARAAADAALIGA